MEVGVLASLSFYILAFAQTKKSQRHADISVDMKNDANRRLFETLLCMLWVMVGVIFTTS